MRFCRQISPNGHSAGNFTHSCIPSRAFHIVLSLAVCLIVSFWTSTVAAASSANAEVEGQEQAERTQESANQEGSDEPDQPRFSGSWRLIEELSDDPDEAVEDAIRAAGGRVRRSFFSKPEKGRHRGGPAEHELYDHISYDEILIIDHDEPEFRFRYFEKAEARVRDGAFERVFHSDGRKRSVQASDLYSGGARDFSFANWNGDILNVESRPRDGGFTAETYRLAEGGEQLRVELTINPDNFGSPIRMLRVYQRE